MTLTFQGSVYLSVHVIRVLVCGPVSSAENFTHPAGTRAGSGRKAASSCAGLHSVN